YVDQADQFLYRDITIAANQPLTVSFNYRTRMATTIGTAASTRTGWFDGDPLNVVDGNFISSTAAGNGSAPKDSFMVYVGAPVNDAACQHSDGSVTAVYDKQRRWFSEVIKRFGPGANYTEIFEKAGNNPVTGAQPGLASDTALATPSSGVLTVDGPT